MAPDFVDDIVRERHERVAGLLSQQRNVDNSSSDSIYFPFLDLSQHTSTPLCVPSRTPSRAACSVR
jgi:hypothetical protein